MISAPSIARINPPELGTPPGYSQIVEVSAARNRFIANVTAPAAPAVTLVEVSNSTVRIS